jgi:O-antigen/teichoic acid export membrane protein
MGLSTVLRLLTGTVVFIILARAWGPERFGVFMYAFTLTSLASLVADYGFSAQLMREVARAPAQLGHAFASVMSAKLMILALVLAAAVLASVWRGASAGETAILWVLLVGGLIGSFAESYIAVFRGLNRYHEETVIMVWVNLLHVGAICLLLWLGSGVLGVAWGILGSRVLFLAMSWRTFRRMQPQLPGFQVGSAAEGWHYIKVGFPFAAESGFTNFQSQADTLIVNYFLGPVAVGVYQAGLRLMQGANSFAQVLSNVYMTAMAGKLDDAGAMKLFGNRLFYQMLLIGALCFLVFTIGAEPITRLLYGAKYAALVELMPWFGLVLLARYVAASHGVILSAIGMQSFRVAAIGGALAVLFAATAVLVPSMKLKGMLLSSLTAVIVLELLYVLSLSLRDMPRGLSRRNVMLLMSIVAASVFLMQYK